MDRHLRDKCVQSIRQIVGPAFERPLLDAAIANLDAPGPLCFNNFSYALRELLRHVLHRLAPDEQVRACSWFKADESAKSGITRAQRATYAIQGGLSDTFVALS